jgi:hypothetical protein
VAELIASRSGVPGCRRIHGLTAVVIRHLPGDSSTAQAVRDAGLSWSTVPGDLTGDGPWLAWRGPQEKLALGFPDEKLIALKASLAPGQCEAAMAADVSDALVIFELHGPRLDDWLAHLVDSAAIPHEPARCSRGRLADVAVHMLRLEPARLWMIVDSPVRGYLENWFAFTHEGAFGSTGGHP